MSTSSGTFVSSVKNYFHPHLLSLKVLYFFQIGATAAIIPYLGVYLEYLGLNTAETGIIFGVLPMLNIVSKPLGGFLMDKLTHKTVMRILTLIEVIFMSSLYFLPAMEPATSVSVSPTDSSATSTVAPAADIVRWTLQFWLSGLLLLASWIGYGSMFTVADVLAFDIIKHSPVETTFGASRVWGTFGYAVFALLSGLMLDGFSETTEVVHDFRPAFGTFAAGIGCALVVTFFLPNTKEEKSYDINNTEEVAVEKATNSVRNLFTFEVGLFWLGALIVGICTGIMYSFLGVYQLDLGGTKMLLGLTVFAQCAYEAPMMACSGWVIRKLGYHFGMVLALFSFGIRYIAYAYIVNTWLFMLTEATHAIGFGLIFPTMTCFAYEKAPPGAVGRLQGVIGATYEGLGNGVGGLVAGFLYYQFGGRTTWLGYGILALVSAGGYFLCSLCLSKRRSPVRAPETATESDVKNG